MKACSIDGCNRTHAARGLCASHYATLIQQKGLATNKKCEVDNCLVGVFAKGLCHKHYELNRRNGSPERKYHKCKAPNCSKNCLNEYCRKHQRQAERGVEFDAPRGWAVKGHKNYNWNGGVSQYPDHWTLKKNRLVVLKNCNYTCECGEKATRVHHVDGSKTNHAIENLRAYCVKCHFSKNHRTPRKNTIYIRQYGRTLKQLSKDFNVSQPFLSRMHSLGQLEHYIKNPLLIGIRKKASTTPHYHADAEYF